MTPDLDRRTFLKSSASAVGMLALPSFRARAAKDVEALLDAPAPAYTGWMDVYREQWTWDSVVRSSHFLNCWYQSHCAWDVYVKDGLVFREEQAAEYPQTSPELPDFNPRGCQKGACFSERMYDPARLRHPLRRVGPRGSGRWEQVSWDEALDAIADTYLDVTIREGTDRTIWDLGPGYNFGTPAAAHGRFAFLTQSVTLDMNPEIGDGHRGVAETFGKIVMERSADDYFHSDLILVWGCNPYYTQIPNAHFFTEARYNGTQLVAIAPDFNASSTHCDLWVPVKPGTDAALALSIAHLIIEEGRVDRDFVVEQTDLPLLVRTDTGRFLVEADLESGGRDDRYAVIDSRSGEVRGAPWRSLALEGLAPDLEGSVTLRLADGSEVEVRTVFSLLRERLREYTPERASELCGTAPDLIRRLARMIASAKAVSNVTSSNFGKYYHGNLIERSLILVLALSGNMGRPGAGYSGFPFLVNDGVDAFSFGLRWKERIALMAAVLPATTLGKLRGDTEEMTVSKIWREFYREGRWCAGVLFWNVHGGLLEVAGRSAEWDPFMKRSVRDHLDEAFEKQWQFLSPGPERPPRILFNLYSNALRRIRGSGELLKTLWPKLELIVNLDWRMSSTGQHADYVLPVATWYERTDHKWVTPLSPFLHTSEQATRPYGESWSEWRILAELTKRIQTKARERGIGAVTGTIGEPVHLDRLYDDFTMDGRFSEDDEAEVARSILEYSSNCSHLDWDELLRKGFGTFRGTGGSAVSIGNMCEVRDDQTIVPLTFHVRDKVPYPTDTRRIQFHVDHPLYHELDEALPRHKDPPPVGGRYPLMLTGGHTRWSIHSAWRDSQTMLRLHRGAPFILISAEDAAQRKLRDGDRVRVWNDIGKCEVRAKVAPQLRPGQTILYHAWEDYQFRGPGTPRDLTPSPINPVELAGGKSHLAPMLIFGHPGQFDRETRVDVARLAPGEAA